MSIKAFFSPNRIYAVVGASSNESKFGHKVLKWYTTHQLPVIPINPTSSKILDITVQKDLQAALRYAKETHPGLDGVSVSFITPPSVSLAVLESVEGEEFEGLIQGVWFQPGSYDSSVIAKARELGIGTVISQGDCILVSGDSGYVESKL